VYYYTSNSLIAQNKNDMYPPHLTAPMAKELNDIGIQSLTSATAVTVCGCAAANARPGVRYALQNEKKPEKLTTVFAGVDPEATAMAREFMLPYPPSSPSIALFKDGKLVHFLERHHIEGRSAEIIAENLKMAFDRYC
jgi:hypothetical protein